MQNILKEDCIITLSNIANFLSIDESIIDKIDQVNKEFTLTPVSTKIDKIKIVKSIKNKKPK